MDSGGYVAAFHLQTSRNERIFFPGISVLRAVLNITNLDLCLPIAFGEDLLQPRLEDADVVVDDGFLLRWVVLSHDAY
jgi:hypothetical protein